MGRMCEEAGGVWSWWAGPRPRRPRLRSHQGEPGCQAEAMARQPQPLSPCRPPGRASSPPGHQGRWRLQLPRLSPQQRRAEYMMWQPQLFTWLPGRSKLGPQCSSPALYQAGLGWEWWGLAPGAGPQAEGTGLEFPFPSWAFTTHAIQPGDTGDVMVSFGHPAGHFFLEREFCH